MSSLEGRLIHRSNLLAKLKDPILPVALRVEPWKRERKRRIVPALRDPRAIVSETKRAERFHQHELTAIKIVEVLVTFQQHCLRKAPQPGVKALRANEFAPHFNIIG